jgi:hypothetical protein
MKSKMVICFNEASLSAFICVSSLHTVAKGKEKWFPFAVLLRVEKFRLIFAGIHMLVRVPSAAHNSRCQKHRFLNAQKPVRLVDALHTLNYLLDFYFNVMLCRRKLRRVFFWIIKTGL